MNAHAPAFTESLSVGAFHGWEPDRFFMFLRAYVDESGTHGADSPRTILAGYVATAAQWRDFDVRWARLMRKYEISHLHTKDFKATRGEFKGWPINRKALFSEDVHRLVQSRTKFGFEVHMDNEEYDRHYVAGDRPKEIPLDSKYGLCFRNLLSWISARSEELLEDRNISIHVVMEAGHNNMGDVNRIFGLFQKQADAAQRARMATVTFAGKHDAPGLQAADFLAYATFRAERNPERMMARPHSGKTLQDARAETMHADRSPVFRLPIRAGEMKAYRENVLAQIAERKRSGARVPRAPASDASE